MKILEKIVLIILDGFGIGKNPDVDATVLAKKPFIDYLFKTYKWTSLNASGEDVGLPAGQMGNSEVGHMNIGAGRIVYQEITRIDRSIRTGEISEKPAFLGGIENVKKKDSSLHLIGLLSDGGVHSMNTHFYALLELAKRNSLKNVFVHIFLDGRDTPPESGARYVKEILGKMGELGTGKIATIMGRYYGMDRDNRWDRTEKAYRAITAGIGNRSADPINAVRSAYAQGVTDEFLLPVVIMEDQRPVASVRDGDSVIFLNFRADRARQLTRALIDNPFDKFRREILNIYFATMTRYHDDFKCPAAFPPQTLENTFGELLAGLSVRQLRIAETEKYAHVTFFFNGGREKPFEGEDRILVPSPRGVATYDLQPEMSAHEVTDRTLESIGTGKYGFILVNYANCDMVGHSGKIDAAVKAVETVDVCLSRVVPAARDNGYTVLVTADHGNVDKMVDDDGQPHTAHTTNLVPFILVHDKITDNLSGGGKLADIAPTIIDLMGIARPEEMDGGSLIASRTGDKGSVSSTT